MIKLHKKAMAKIGRIL